MKFADVIVDISHENLDKTYQYIIPKDMEEKVTIGTPVNISFGRGSRIISGYVVGLSSEPKFDVSRTKPILEISKNGLTIEMKLIRLAYWIKEHFGSTMNDALRTVIPVKRKVKAKEERYLKLIIEKEKALELLELWQSKHYVAKVRLLEALIEKEIIEYEVVTKEKKVSKAVIDSLQKENILKITSNLLYRNPVKETEKNKVELVLTKEQQAIADDFAMDYNNAIRKTYLLHGVTGSGKTEVYMDMIYTVLKQKKQVILLIPEIALTYQNVKRFYGYFGDRISILNSKMSAGERYDQYLRAKNSEIDIMIGPRSALFTPFPNLGLVIMDEEHEGSYKSETPPKYHARETAIERARLENASVVLGSATPSLLAYTRAKNGEYKYYNLKNRVYNRELPNVSIVDLRVELREGNKSIFSRELKQKIEERLNNKEQIMLFINRRGFSGFVSCRSCGHVMKCPHCDISLTAHNNGKLVCHYCGYEEKMPDKCPSCNSPYIAMFGTGTQKVEQYVKKEFKNARVLRMDTDTTSKKDGHEKILSAFARKEADILVGTQMIVKGHDFANVTLVGIIAADLSLYASDYSAGEKTFQLLTQAAGRAGRGDKPGDVVIQTYKPDHYSITSAANQNYEEFYLQEMNYRNVMEYPPVASLLVILVSSKDEEKAEKSVMLINGAINEWCKKDDEKSIKVIGPTKALLYKANDMYRRIIYLKSKSEELLIELKDYLEGYIEFSELMKGLTIQFDFNPLNF